MVFTLGPPAHRCRLFKPPFGGRISRSSDIVRFVYGGVVKTFRCATSDSAMGDILTLDDGRKLSGSSFGISGLLFLVAEHLPDGNDQLKLWLIDVSNRTNGLMGVDLRGLEPDFRAAFHAGARAAYDATVGSGAEITPQSFALATLDRFISMQDSLLRGDAPESLTDCGVSDTDPFIEDINELWNPNPD